MIIHKNAPKVIKCDGNDILWLSYQVHLQKLYRDKMAPLNDRFAIIVAYGQFCNDPASTVHESAIQADCNNFEVTHLSDNHNIYDCMIYNRNSML